MFFKHNCFTFYNVKVWKFLSEFRCVIFQSMSPSWRPLEAVALLQQARGGTDIWSLNLKEHCSRLFDQHVLVWEKKTGILFMSQPAHQPLAVSVCLPPGSKIWALPKTGEQRVRETKSNLTFCSYIQSSRLVCDGIVRPLKAVFSLWFLDIQLSIWHSGNRLFGVRELRWSCLEGWPCCLSKGVHGPADVKRPRSSKPLMETDRQFSRSALICWPTQSLI